MVSPKDGKRYSTDVADMEGMFRIIQSIPSKKAEPFKIWMAQVAAERINQAIDPERSINQAIVDYRRLGYSEAWINQRIKTIEIRKGLTDEWKRGGVTQEVDFAFLTDLMRIKPRGPFRGNNPTRIPSTRPHMGIAGRPWTGRIHVPSHSGAASPANRFGPAIPGMYKNMFSQNVTPTALYSRRSCRKIIFYRSWRGGY